MSYKIIFLAICAPILVQGLAGQFRIDLEVDNVDNLDNVYERSRNLLSIDEREFLEEILAADEATMERQKRGIVDQILAAIAGIAPGASLIGTSATAAPVAAVAPAAPSGAAKSDANNATTANCGTPCTTNARPSTTATASAPATMQGTANNENDNHLFAQISKVVLNSATRNVTGIVDEALKIGTPAPVRDLVNGILGVAYCNGIRRLLGRC